MKMKPHAPAVGRQDRELDRRLRGLTPGFRWLPRAARDAFTLVEIMIVVAILGVVLGIGIPSIFRAMRKEGMRLATSDVLDACKQAREAAILTGQPVELQFLPESREFKIVPVSEVNTNLIFNVVGQPEGVPATLPPEAPVSSAKMPEFSGQLPKNVWIELLDVNYVEMKDYPDVRVRFHPNSTSDEFTIVLRSDQEEWRKISLEVTTALADVSVIR